MAKFIELHKGKETYLVNLDTVSMVTGNTMESESWWYYTDGGGEVAYSVFDESYEEARELIASAQGGIPMGRAGNG